MTQQASALRVLSALTGTGYLERHPRHLTYALGVTLVAAGQAATLRHPAVRAAQAEMEALVDALGVQCEAVTVDDSGTLVIGEAGQGTLSIGTRLPRLPTVGLAHWAFATEEQREAWLDSTPFDPSQADILRSAFEAIRSRGFAMALDGPVRAAMRQELEHRADRASDREIVERFRELWKAASPGEIQQIEIDRDTEYAVAHLAAPVFGPTGEVCLEIVLRRLPDRLRGHRVLELADRLRTACGAITRRTHGRAPETVRHPAAAAVVAT
jgi:DNA-binding IclR family transcriptional regulator